ncbi:carbohydrate ABC transporter permease [Clostridioides difficile]|uniref:carbohydrate ABC transporter permease n=1 Tax=Clostridioides difficile TaxID=1496 RepID=UPI001C183E87|nr:carbohydrate ABC transporter permease [Clostridioides difficile]MDL0325745.1 carbohydrate ABC transporter permease [Clostridioides difficile]MDL0328719.1 carbohydrate ABC transporter permease [Clostridioides difficile]HBF9958696.1 carbohydrate ABC transporter permease [Clostridioides difficile]HCU2865738.1 carbohydrate ABC transporter permease [Clostridioides difficile]HDC4900655.1 carbohydrate ABC transporter permease [Clostridioides difficile]
MKTARRLLSDGLLLFIACASLVPFIYMLIISLKITYNSYSLDISFSTVTLQNYIDIFTKKGFAQYFFNTAIASFSGVLLNLVFSTLAGYSFAKMDFKGSDKLFLFMIMTLIIPSQVTMIPLYIIMKHLGWINSYLALIMPIPTAFGVFIMRQAILGVPKELLESAKIDGCSDFRILIQIVLPLIKPALITLAIFTFMGAWNEFMWPLIATTKDAMRTLTVGLSTLKTFQITNYGQMMAGATITFLPPFIFYLILQSKFVEGVSLSGIKG